MKPFTVDKNEVVAVGVYDFMVYLSIREERFEVGDGASFETIIKHYKAWAKLRNVKFESEPASVAQAIVSGTLKGNERTAKKRKR